MFPPPRGLHAVFCTLLALEAVNCKGKPSAYTGGAIDANFVLDGGCVIHGLNCAQVGDCTDPCGTSQSCVDHCAAAGCASAKDVFDKVEKCTIAKCWARCAGGGTADCNRCSADKCSAENAACDADSCPVVCLGADGGGDSSMDGSGLGSDGGSGPLACLQVYACLGRCALETPILCVHPCKTQGCPGAVTTLEAALACADLHCKDLLGDHRCLGRYASGDCQACLAEKCVTQWSACSAQEC